MATKGETLEERLVCWSGVVLEGGKGGAGARACARPAVLRSPLRPSARSAPQPLAPTASDSFTSRQVTMESVRGPTGSLAFPVLCQCSPCLMELSW